MLCPRCGARLAVREFGSVRLDGCDECGGVWFDAEELNQLSRDPSVTLSQVERAFEESPLGVAVAGPMACPKCLLPLVPFAFPHTPEVRLDACRECKGVWLDDGELDALAARIQRHRTESKPDPSDEGSLRDRTRAAAAMLLSAPCPNCRTANPAGSVTCFRCGSRTEGSSAHGLCPRCDRRLEEMPTASLHLRLEGCRACGGVWFAEGRLAVFLRLDRESVAAAQKWTGASGLAAMPGNLSGRATAYCPGCHFPMERRPFAGGQSVEIDRCANCEGVWLDGGELMSLHRYLQVHGVPEATTRADAWGEGA